MSQPVSTHRVENKCNKSERTRYESERGDDDVADRDLEEARPGRAGGAVEPDLLEDDVLVEVDAVEAARRNEKG